MENVKSEEEIIIVVPTVEPIQQDGLIVREEMAEKSVRTALQKKNHDSLVARSQELTARANALVIDDAISFEEALKLEKELKIFTDREGSLYDQVIKGLDKLHSFACSLRKDITAGPQSAWKSLKDRRAKWQVDEEEKRVAAERRAEEEARRIEDERKAKIQAKIDEEKRKIREAKEEEDRIQRAKDAEIKATKDKTEKERLRREEEERRERESKKIEHKEVRAEERKYAYEDKKANLYVAPKPVPVVVTAPATVLFNYEPRVTNKNIIPEMFKIVDLKLLAKMQKDAKGQLQVPGVDFVKVPIGRTGKVS